MEDQNKESESTPPQPKFYLECTEHGHQEPVLGTVHKWDEETEQILREQGVLAEVHKHHEGPAIDSILKDIAPS